MNSFNHVKAVFLAFTFIIGLSTAIIAKAREEIWHIPTDPIDIYGEDKILSDDLNACHKAVENYRPSIGSPLNESNDNKEKYLKSCLTSLKDLPSEIATILKHSVSVLKNSHIPGCNVYIVTPKIALTARHCFVEIPKTEEDMECEAQAIPDNLLSESVISGIGKDGKEWSVSGLAIMIDPFDKSDNYFVDIENHCGQARYYDFILISPKDSRSKFYFDKRIDILGSKDVALLPQGTRLIFSWFNQSNLTLYTDYLDTCLIRSQHQNHWFEHHCQSLPTSSGAPIFLLDNGRLKLVGVHVSGPYYVGNSYYNGSNTAITLPDKLVEHLNKIMMNINV
jgi:V8-like Glu-specific endopeptidase